VARQRAGWDPLLDWALQRFGARMAVAEGLTHVDQPADALAVLRRALVGFDAFTLGGLHVVASITGSTVLALAVAEGLIPGARAFELSRIDEAYQAERWGEDAEAAKRTAALAHELDKAVELIDAARM
jgi:chaperone required for assembly of F1-ATPase